MHYLIFTFRDYNFLPESDSTNLHAHKYFFEIIAKLRLSYTLLVTDEILLTASEILMTVFEGEYPS